MNLRDSARGQECFVRMDCCNGNPETTVLAHFRMSGICGIGQKPPDECAAFACSACHDAIDGRVPREDREADQVAFLRGVLKTLHWHIRQGRKLK